MISIYQPYKLSNAKKYLNKCINQNWISWSGEYVQKCEDYLSNKLDIKHVLLINNGTAGVHCLMKAIKWKNPNCKKIYIPNHCYIAVYNMPLVEFKENEIEILPINMDTWNIEIDDLDKLEENSAILVVHNLGNIYPIDEIQRKRPDIIIVEDNCEGFMGKYSDNKYSGTLSLASCLSFFSNKHITCAEGGAFLTNDTDLYEYIKKFTRQGQTNIKYQHDIIAFNYRLSNIHSALLYSQLELLEEIMNKKKRIFLLYQKYLKKNKNIVFSKIENNTEHSYWIVNFRIKNNPSFSQFSEFMLTKNIETRPFFYDIRIQEHLKELKCGKIQKKLENEIVMLPSYPSLKTKQVKYICNCVNEYCHQYI